MNMMSSPALAASSVFATPARSDPVAPALFRAADILVPRLIAGEAITSKVLRAAMEEAFGASDAEGAWTWKQAYEACEAAQVLFLRRFWPAMASRAKEPASVLTMLAKLAALLPTQTRRSEDSQALQQFSTPIELAYAVSAAAAIRPGDLVLEPSAGTGMLAIFAELAGAKLALNEITVARSGLLRLLFPQAPISRHNAEQIHDHLDVNLRPNVILMNPPFSASPSVEGRFLAATSKHLSSAFARLAPGGRLVAITGENFSPDNAAWRAAFERIEDRGGKVVFSGGIEGRVFARHGTHVPTRLTVIDKDFCPTPGRLRQKSLIAASNTTAASVWELLALVERQLPVRPHLHEPNPISPAPELAVASRFAIVGPAASLRPARLLLPPKGLFHPERAVELVYEVLDATERGAHISDGLYEPYALQTIYIPGASAHPTPLVQSAAMASVTPLRPTYRPSLLARIVPEGVLSDAQLETVIYAGEAHSAHLAGRYLVDDTFDRVSVAPADAPDAVKFRRGFFIGDGTGTGKGREVAGAILDNWLKGRRRALWISKSDTLIEDAQRDWTAIGGERFQIVPLSKYRQGKAITLTEGILFATYATLRSEEREGKASRVQQIVDWLGRDFDGVIVETTRLLDAFGEPDEEAFRTAVEEIDERVLGTAREFFSLMRQRGATLRVVAGDRDNSFGTAAVARAAERATSTVLREGEETIDGQLAGVLPDAHQFEFRASAGRGTLRGRVNRVLTADQLSRYNRDLVNLDARGRFYVKRLLRNDEVVRETYTLLELTPVERG